MSSVLGYWNHRALAGSLRLILHYVGENFEDKRYQVGPPPDFDKSCWLDDKNLLPFAAPNLPYYINEAKNVYLTQTNAILFYLASTYSLQGKTLLETSNAIMAVEVMKDWLNDFFDVTYCDWLHNRKDLQSNDFQAEKSSASFEKRKNVYLEEVLHKHLKMLEAVYNSSSGDWLAGDSLTFSDFVLAEIVDQHLIFCENSIPSTEYPGIISVYEKVMNFPSVKEYRNSPEYKAEPLHNRYSHFHTGWIKNVKNEDNPLEK